MSRKFDTNKHQLSRAVDWRVFEVQSSLVSTQARQEDMEDGQMWLLPQHYEDVVEERVAMGNCGYPLCRKVLPDRKTTRSPGSPSSPDPKYRISYQEKRVYEIGESEWFCCVLCQKSSRTFGAGLSNVNPFLRNCAKKIDTRAPRANERVDKVLEALNVASARARGMNTDGSPIKEAGGETARNLVSHSDPQDRGAGVGSDGDSNLSGEEEDDEEDDDDGGTGEGERMNDKVGGMGVQHGGETKAESSTTLSASPGSSSPPVQPKRIVQRANRRLNSPNQESTLSSTPTARRGPSAPAPPPRTPVDGENKDDANLDDGRPTGPPPNSAPPITVSFEQFKQRMRDNYKNDMVMASGGSTVTEMGENAAIGTVRRTPVKIDYTKQSGGGENSASSASSKVVDGDVEGTSRRSPAKNKGLLGPEDLKSPPSASISPPGSKQQEERSAQAAAEDKEVFHTSRRAARDSRNESKQLSSRAVDSKSSPMPANVPMSEYADFNSDYVDPHPFDARAALSGRMRNAPRALTEEVFVPPPTTRSARVEGHSGRHSQVSSPGTSATKESVASPTSSSISSSSATTATTATATATADLSSDTKTSLDVDSESQEQGDIGTVSESIHTGRSTEEASVKFKPGRAQVLAWGEKPTNATETPRTTRSPEKERTYIPLESWSPSRESGSTTSASTSPSASASSTASNVAPKAALSGQRLFQPKGPKSSTQMVQQVVQEKPASAVKEPGPMRVLDGVGTIEGHSPRDLNKLGIPMGIPSPFAQPGGISAKKEKEEGQEGNNPEVSSDSESSSSDEASRRENQRKQDRRRGSAYDDSEDDEDEEIERPATFLLLWAFLDDAFEKDIFRTGLAQSVKDLDEDLDVLGDGVTSLRSRPRSNAEKVHLQLFRDGWAEAERVCGGAGSYLKHDADLKAYAGHKQDCMELADFRYASMMLNASEWALIAIICMDTVILRHGLIAEVKTRNAWNKKVVHAMTSLSASASSNIGLTTRQLQLLREYFD